MKKFSKVILVLCFVMIAAISVFACKSSSNSGLEFKSVDGYPSATVNKSEKRISFTTPYETIDFELTAIKFKVDVTIKAYSDSERQNKLSAIDLAVGVNTYYLIVASGGVSENWQLVITRTAPDAQVSSISVAAFETVYEVGDAFAGGKLNVKYDNGQTSQVNITSSMLSGFDTATAGIKTVTVTYKSKTVTVTIIVIGDLVPTTLVFEEIEGDIDEVLCLLYLVSTGEMIEKEDMLELMFDGDAQLMTEVYETIHEKLEELAFTKAEIKKLAEVANDVVDIADELYEAAMDFDGEGGFISVAMVNDIVAAYNDIKLILNPIRIAKLLPYIQSVGAGNVSRANFNYDDAIRAADEMNLAKRLYNRAIEIREIAEISVRKPNKQNPTERKDSHSY